MEQTQPTQGEGPWSAADHRNGSDIESDSYIAPASRYTGGEAWTAKLAASRAGANDRRIEDFDAVASKVWSQEDAEAAERARVELPEQHKRAEAYGKQLAREAALALEADQRARWTAMQQGGWSGRSGDGVPVWHAGDAQESPVVTGEIRPIKPGVWEQVWGDPNVQHTVNNTITGQFIVKPVIDLLGMGSAVVRDDRYDFAQLRNLSPVEAQRAKEDLLILGATSVVPGFAEASVMHRSALAETVTVYRVEGAGNQRLFIEGGDVEVPTVLTSKGRGPERNLYLNFGDEARAQEFLDLRLKQFPDNTIKTFEVPRSFVDELSASAVDEPLRQQYPNRPVVADPTKASNQFGLSTEQIEQLRQVIIPGSAKVYGHR